MTVKKKFSSIDEKNISVEAFINLSNVQLQKHRQKGHVHVLQLQYGL